MRNIFLVGLSGSGKSSVGRLLAERLDIPFYDTDVLVEEQCGMTIAAIFAERGETYFRDCESRVLAEVARKPEGAVIATGGGIVLRKANRELLHAQGASVYLSVHPTIALERLAAQHEALAAADQVPEIRPLLAGSEPLTTLQQLLETRSTWYEDADFTCSTEGKSAEQIVHAIIAMLICSYELDGIPPTVQRVHVGNGYDVVVDWGGLGRLPGYLKALQLPKRVFLITDSNLRKLYVPTLIGALLASGFEPEIYTVPAGEASKSPEQLNAIYDWLIGLHAERGEAIVALGGGVVGDMAGYVAATYLRGVPLVQVPTSLLAQVDAAIGGKTGINHPKGKNLIGAFYHPRLVLVDPATLLTLPERERTEGWAEVVKYGIILDTELFVRLEAYAATLRKFVPPSATLLCQIIARCIALKVAVIEEDEREQGRRAILNYGHTVAHALENVAGYGELLHGEAVSIGMVAAAALAQEMGLFATDEARRQNHLLQALGLPVSYAGNVKAEDILAAMQLDKKVVGKRVHWIMPRTIGEVTITSLPDDLVRRIITTFFAE
ncbi:MAG TPA: 3-dehydroquinate synthase [Ktedonobacteraceae bacterium]|nr:3-dehydroquinate synthase [Ktedonobacteraceae bacterium]